MARISRALVMPGDGTWELRELPGRDAIRLSLRMSG
jgi:hypothetical protein